MHAPVRALERPDRARLVANASARAVLGSAQRKGRKRRGADRRGPRADRGTNDAGHEARSRAVRSLPARANGGYDSRPMRAFRGRIARRARSGARGRRAVALAIAAALTACGGGEEDRPKSGPKSAATSGGARAAGAGGAGGEGDAGGNGAGGDEGVIVDEQVRDYEGVCNDGDRPEWTLFVWKATTPGDSSIAFEARTADTQPELDDAEAVPLAKAKKQSGNATFTNVGAKLPKQQSKRWLRIVAVFRADETSGEAPVIHEIQMQYDCLPKE